MWAELDFANGQPKVAQASNEVARQQALDDLSVIDTEPEARIDLIMTLTRNLFGTSGAAVTFIDHERAWVKSALGMDDLDEPRIGAFCDMTIRQAELFVVEDAALDPRFRDHPSECGSMPGIRSRRPRGAASAPCASSTRAPGRSRNGRQRCCGASPSGCSTNSGSPAPVASRSARSWRAHRRLVRRLPVAATARIARAPRRRWTAR
jgi:hypothetical protein